MTSASRRLPVDTLPDAALAIQVLRVEGFEIGSPREPHRHDYHELIWIREGAGEHLIDGRVVPAEPGAITIIGRGSVHVFARGSGLAGAVIRFSDESVLGSGGRRATPPWLLAAHGERTVPVPEDEVALLESAIEALAAETERDPDVRSAEIEGHLLAALLLWIDRWYDASGDACPDPADPDTDVLHSFTRLLEAQFAAHHDARWYADALAMPAAALSRALSGASGRTTKELITDRLMLEAMRLLRFTDQTVGEIAFQLGYEDPFYFSRAFKRHTGFAPVAYRDLSRS